MNLPDEFELVITQEDIDNASYYGSIVDCPLSRAVRRILGIDDVRSGTGDFFVEVEGNELHYEMMDDFAYEDYCLCKKFNIEFKTKAYTNYNPTLY